MKKLIWALLSCLSMELSGQNIAPKDNFYRLQIFFGEPNGAMILQQVLTSIYLPV
ncbi:hypothetical protein [Solitalea lacus]|uniref:hypothetical protein n=1 Tax=Solitalea lacus TaxID=2911172 RepID=UPI001ED9D9A3|nr:hypothetical protein [Solitalea lacus]UKJ08596.1 hypothetical protein L2B55_05375 [Solitalea lacus]